MILRYFIYKNKFYDKVVIGRSAYQNMILRRIGRAGLICVACFLFRALFTVLQLKIASIAANPYIFGPYFLILDVLPLSLMLSVLANARSSQSADSSGLTPTTPLIGS
jgi:hypothetical protein